MKKLSYLFLVLLSLSFVACSSNDSSNDENNNTNDELYLKFTVNGVNYDFDPETLTSLQKLIMGQKDINNITTRLSLWMPVTPTVGSHSITDDTPTDANLTTLHNAAFYVGNNTYEAVNGTLIVTELGSNYVKGTFNFVAEDINGVTVTVSNGSFRANR